MRLAGRTAVVTGAGSGFGAAIARRYAREGARVVCVDLREDAADAVAAGLDGAAGRGVAIACDIADGASVRAMVEQALAAVGSFDVLVNNAALT